MIGSVRGRSPRERKRRGTRPGRLQRSWPAALTIAVLLFTASPHRLGAQELPAVLGGVAGLLGGFAVTTGLFVAEARAGHFVYSVDDLATWRWEYLPVPVGIVGGAWAGAKDADLLKSLLVGGGVGLGGGVAIGWFVGHAVWAREEGRWAGAVIGGSLGLLLGTVIGGFAYEGEERGTGGGVELGFHIGTGG